MNLLRKHLLKLSRIPADLDAVTTIDSSAEVDPAEVGMHRDDIEAIWRQVQHLYRCGAHPAITLCLRRRGRVILSRAIGHTKGNGPDDNPDAERVLARPDTPFCLFSSSKGITAVLMHMLAEDGLINVMDPVAFYLPEFARNGKENISIHQILSHRGGIPGLPTEAGIEMLWNEERVWQLLCEARPIISDGSKLAYHAITGGFVLERVLKKVTGEDFNAYIERKIRRPMGMTYCTYGVAPEHAADLARAYATGPYPGPLLAALMKRAVGADLSSLEEIANDPRFQATSIPAANLVANADEVSAFYQMMLDGGRWNGQRICDPATVARSVQAFGNRTLDRILLMPLRFSAGLMLGDEPFGVWGPHTRDAFGHVGMTNKFNWADPERAISVSLLNSGITLVSHHLLPLINVIRTICDRAPRRPLGKSFAVAVAQKH